MKTLIRKQKARLAATSLVLVLVVSAAGIMLVGGVMAWISTNTDLTLRLNRYRVTTAAGGAATEKVVSEILSDFQTGGITEVANNLSTYSAIVPADQDLLDPITGILNPITGILEPSPKPAPEPDATTSWSNYEFSDGKGNKKRNSVGVVSPWAYTKLTSQFSGLNAYASTYRLVSNVRDSNHRHKTLAGVQQELVLASIPVFGFHVFYAPDLEICPSAAMTLDRVHANQNIYCQPTATLTFAGPVTTARRVIHNKHPADPSSRTPGQIVSVGERENGVNTLLPALGTNRGLAAFRSMIEVPPANESRTSTLGRQRLYNKADLIIKISSSGFAAHSGAYNNFTTVVPWSQLGETVTVTPGKKIASATLPNGLSAISALQTSKAVLKSDDDDEEDEDDDGKSKDKDKDKDKDKGKGKDDEDDDDDDDDDRDKSQPGVTNVVHGVVNTNVTFYNMREAKTVRAVEIDINQLLLKYSYLTSVLGRPVKTLYVVDTRSPIGGSQPGIRIVNGAALPSNGLTIVSPNPLYVWGSYNAPTNATQPVPAALVGDAITILSPLWQDINSSSNLTKRVAANTTVNAALLAGIVPTGGGYYSGGLENLPRLLEDWTGKTLTLKGSLAALYHSAVATAPWGASASVYKPPQRNWSYDSRFNTLAGLPPSTPELRTAFRRSWQNVAARK